MKIKKQQKRLWEPMTLEITIDSVEEARLLFHCLNRVDLLEVLRKVTSYGFSCYNEDIASCFSGLSEDVLEKMIKDRGFEV